MPKVNNSPTGELRKLDGTEFVGQTVDCILELHKMGRPQTDEECEERIEQFFRFCADHNYRPGIESLATALGTTRQNLNLWENGVHCSQERAEMIKQAKQIVATFIEAASLNGKINPVSAIFYSKNWFGYSDKYEMTNTPADKTQYILPGEKVREELAIDEE